MNDLYLRFSDQATMLEALRPLGMTYTTDEVEMVSQGGHQYACWEVGLLPDSPTDWHLNLRVVDPEFDVSSLEQYAVFPRNPRCVFA
jgi:hypothetical protein